jgi:2-oxoglutarate dehydrogenase E2 component (dihydrolipoamide succinyltransferase)
MRRRIAERMVHSLLQTAPHVTTVFEADLGNVLAHRARHRDAFSARGAPLTLTAYFVQACVDAIRSVPESNARWSEDALDIYRYVDIGIATSLGERGLVVPVLRRADELNLQATAQRLADLTLRARDERLTPADVRPGTFTISNHGVSGSLFATPVIINQPQSAILGIGKLEKRVVVLERDGVEAIAIRPRCYVTLTIDHRVMDGERANQFLTTFVRRLENWTE